LWLAEESNDNSRSLRDDNKKSKGNRNDNSRSLRDDNKKNKGNSNDNSRSLRDDNEKSKGNSNDNSRSLRDDNKKSKGNPQRQQQIPSEMTARKARTTAKASPTYRPSSSQAQLAGR
jgi:hypothetical protein